MRGENAAPLFRFEMQTFDLLSPGGQPIFLACLPNERGYGTPHDAYVRNEVQLQHFISQYNREGWALYRAVAILRDGSRRNQQNVVATRWIWAEVDFKDHRDIAPEEIRRRLETIPLRPTLIIFSGHGYHLYWQLKEEEDAAPGEGQQRVTEALRLACNYVGGDSAVAETARLMRLPGSHNTRVPGEKIEVVFDGVDVRRVYDLGELVDFFLEAQPIIPPVTPKSNGHAKEFDFSQKSSAPVDVEVRLAVMRYKGEGDSSIHETQLSVTGSLTRAGRPVEETVARVLARTREVAPASEKWDWDEERRAIEEMCYSLVNKAKSDGDDLSHVLPDKLYRAWQTVLERGRRPNISRNPGGFYVRATRDGKSDTVSEAPFDRKSDEKSDNASDEKSDNGPKENGEPKKYRFKLIPFWEMRPGVGEQPYLVDELLPSRGIVVIWGAHKSFKSFVTLDIMFHVARGKEYHDRAVQQGTIAYCAFEGGHGYRKRIEALRRHHKLPEDERTPIFVMAGSANLIEDHRLLVNEIRDQLGAVVPIAVVLDTLNKSLHGSESKDVDMGKYIAAAEAIREAFNCLVIIVHHSGWDATRLRGHSSLPGAVDAEISVRREAEMATVTVELMRDGPEGQQIILKSKKTEVGYGANGELLTSLVFIPHDGTEEAVIRKEDWPDALREIRKALVDAILTSGFDHQIEGGPAVKAADLDIVRNGFFNSYIVASDAIVTEEARKSAKRMAFKRQLDLALRRGFICGQSHNNGSQFLWFVSGDPNEEPPP
jgi:AAA domain